MGRLFQFQTASRLTPGVAGTHEAAYIFPDSFQLNPGIYDIIEHGAAFPVPDTSRLTPGVTVKHRIDMEHGAALPVLPDSFQTDGVVFAFAAYYRNSNPVRFQLWRPVESTDTGDVQTAAPASSSTSETTMRLLGQLTITPSVQDSRETVCTST